MGKQAPRVVCIVGQTATGKSDLAVALARKYDGEIISADSRQVYSGLDVGSGKITPGETKGVRHHVLDVANPKGKRYTAADFAADAKSAASEIFSRGKLILVCGGTGFYIEAFLHGGNLPDVAPDQKLRARLGKLGAAALLAKLRRLDPVRAKSIDPRNIVRIIRAIEIAAALGKVPKQESKKNYDVLTIGLTLSPAILKKKIHARLAKRMRGDALIKEVRNLHRRGVSWKRLYDFGLEYRYVALYLQKKISREEMFTRLEREIYQYSKRQMTWFKRDKKTKWFSPSDKSEIEKVVRTFIDKKKR